MRRGYHPQLSPDTKAIKKTNEKRYIAISTRFMTTKLGQVVAYNIGLPRLKTHDCLLT